MSVACGQGAGPAHVNLGGRWAAPVHVSLGGGRARSVVFLSAPRPQLGGAASLLSSGLNALQLDVPSFSKWRVSCFSLCFSLRAPVKRSHRGLITPSGSYLSFI